MSDEEKSIVEGEEEEEEITDLSDSDVCTKYQDASKVVNLALQGLVSQCLPGAKVLDLCEFGHTVINAQTQKLFTKKVDGRTIDRGVAFPICISVNDIVCNHSPLPTEETEPLKAGDIVKMDLGCHIDGYIAVAAHTCIVPESADTPPTLDAESPTGTVAVAAYKAMLIAAASITAGAKNTEVTAAIERVANAYGVTPIHSVRMHQMKRYVLDGVKEVALKTFSPDDEMEERLPDCTFEQFEVYAVDVAMSTGEGNARPGDLRTTVFKRNVEQQYSLKVQASRAVLAEVDKKFPTLPFTLRHLSDTRKARLGIPECVSHGLLTPYPSLHEHSGTVAHFKCTVLLLPSGTSRVTGLEMPAYFQTDKQPDEETAKILKGIEDEAAKKAARKAAKKNKKKAKK